MTANSASAASAGSTAATDISQRFALDTQGFDALRQAAKSGSPGSAKVVAKQFDALFLQMMLKSMRDATPSKGLLDSDTGKTYTSMLDQQLAQHLSSKGVGLADQLLGQLTRNIGAAGTGANGLTGTSADGASGANGQSNLTADTLSGLSSAAGARAYRTQGQSGANGALGGPALDAAPTLRGTGKSAHASAFVDKLSSAAQSASQATGIPTRLLLSQAALESGWGRREITRPDGTTSYNVMGVKAGKDWTGPTVETATTEYVHGVAQKITAKFRAYGSYQEAMTDYASTLKSNPRYAPVLAAAGNPAAAAQQLQRSGYATDPQYAKKLISIMGQFA